MNYIEFQIGGKLRGFRFGLKFLSDLFADLNVGFDGLGKLIDENPFKSRPAVLYHAHVNHCKSKGIPITFTQDDVYEWLETLPSGVSNDNVVQCTINVLESIKAHLPKTEEVEPQDEKKN